MIAIATTPIDPLHCSFPRSRWWSLLQENFQTARGSDDLDEDEITTWAYMQLRRHAAIAALRLGLREPDAASMLAHEAVIRLNNDAVRARFDPRRGSAWGFIWGILWNLGREHVRRIARERAAKLRIPSHSDMAECPCAVAQRNEVMAVLKGVFAELSLDERQVLVTRFGPLFGATALPRRDSGWDEVQLHRLLKHLRIRLDRFG